MKTGITSTGFDTGSMTVTGIEPVKRHTVRVFLNDEPAMRLSVSEAEQLHLAEGLSITAEQYMDICRVILLKKAKLRCLDILTARDKTEKELFRTLLAEDVPVHVAEEAIAYVKSFHYVDDKRYAMHYIEAKSSSQSRMQILISLREKGISEELIEEAYAEAESVAPIELIRKFAVKRKYDPVNADESSKVRFYQFLMRKGFSYRDIENAMSEWTFDDENGQF